MADFIKGLRYALSGFSLIIKPGIRLFVLIPLLINTLLFALAIIYGASRFNALLNELTVQWAWLEWIAWLLWPLFLLILLGIVFFSFTILANLISAPFNGQLAAAVERDLTGVTTQEPTSLAGLFNEAKAAIGSESVKIRFFLVRGLPLLLLFLIPVLQIAAPLIWFIYAAWMVALEYLEIPLGNHAMLFPQVRILVANKRSQALGFGTGILLLMMLPGINFMVMPVAVAAATRMALETWSDKTRDKIQFA